MQKHPNSLRNIAVKPLKLRRQETFIKLKELYPHLLFDMRKYTTQNTNITYYCKRHKHLHNQTPANMFNNKQCKFCKAENKSHVIKRIEQASPGKYLLRDIKYFNTSTPVTVICKKHGPFNMCPHDLMRGRGCQECGREASAWHRTTYQDKKTILYYIKVDNLYKVGITRQSVKRRYKSEQHLSIETIQEWEFSNGALAFDLERAIIKKARSSKYTGFPVFKRGGDSELFTTDILYIIKELINGITIRP